MAWLSSSLLQWLGGRWTLVRFLAAANVLECPIFERANHLSISPSHSDQLILLSSAGREMSTSKIAVMLCGCGVRAHSTCG